MARLVISANARQVSVAVTRRGHLRDVQVFARAQEGEEAFARWLAPYSRLPAYLTVDTPDEDYRVETLPHTSGQNRRALLGRKLRQFYRESALRAAQVIDRMPDKRRDDCCLFTAITDDSVLNPWLQRLQRADAAVAGVFPMPMLLVDALRALGLSAIDLLVIAPCEGGIRQTYFKGGWPRVTRVTLLAAGEPIAVAANEEVQRTMDYLGASNIAAPTQSLRGLVLDADGRLAQLAGAADNGRLQWLYVSPQELARRLRLDPASVASAFQMQLLARHRPKLNLAPLAVRATYLRRRLAHRTMVAAGVLAVASGTVAAFDVESARSADRLRGMVVEDLARERARHASIVPQSQASPDQLLRIFDATHGWPSATRLSEQTYLAVSKALDANPKLTLVSLEWRANSVDDGLKRDAAAGRSDAHVVVRLRFNSELGGLRDAIAAMDGFVDAVRAQPFVIQADIAGRPDGFDPLGVLRAAGPQQRLAASLEFEAAVDIRWR